MAQINGFEQIKSFYSWVFNNPDKIRPTHISLYLFLWNQANRANWVEWFKCPYDLAMQGACIGNKGTYYRCLDDLSGFGLIDYQKGMNNFKAPLVHLIQLYNSGQLTEQVTVPLSEPQTVPLSVPLSVPQCEPQYVPIYKLVTDNLEPITNNLKAFDDFILSLSKTESVEDREMIEKEVSEIYSLYPSICPSRKSNNGKSQKDKVKIKAILKSTPKDQLRSIIERYVKECTASKTYMKNFSTFLNNLPDFDSKPISQLGSPVGRKVHYKLFGQYQTHTEKAYKENLQCSGAENVEFLNYVE